MKRARAILLRAVLLLAVVGAFALLLTTYSPVRSHLGTDENFGLPEPEGYDLTDEVYMDEVSAFSENGRTLYVSEGGVVRLEDDATGQTLWRNAAAAEDVRLFGTEDAAISPLSITYRYDGETDITLYSDTDAVQNDQYTTAYSADGERLRVTYLFGETGQSGLLPYGLTQEYMEEELLPQLSEEDQEFLLARYKLYTAQDAKSIVLETCPGVRETPVYYLENPGSFVLQNRTIACLERAGLTQESYEAQCALTGEQPATYDESYLVTVEYWLEDGDLMINIPCDEILFHPENPLTTLTLNGAATYAEQTQAGSYLLPAGSGALQRFSDGTERNNAYRFYGADSLNTVTTAEEQTFPFPAYGMLREDGSGLLAVIEQGAELATLNERFTDGACQLALSFQILDYGDSSVTVQQTSTVFNGSTYQGDLTVRYQFLSEADSFTDLAAAYRRLLLKQEKLPETAADTGSLLIELVGNVSYSYQWAGLIPATRQLALTDWETSLAICRTLTDAGLEPALKLSGYNQGGLFCQVPGKYRWASCLGSASAREAFLQFLAERGLDTYLDVNLAYFYAGQNQLFTGYSAHSMSAHFADNQTASRALASPSASGALAKAGTLYVVSPFGFGNYAASYAENLDVRLGVSLGDSLLSLSTDYTEKHPQNRNDALNALTGAVAELSQERPVMGKNPLVTALQDLTMAEELGMAGSASYAVSEYVPFLQTVLHGHVNYTCVPLNGTSDYRTALLQAVETGSALKYTLSGGFDRRLMETEYGYLYYADWDKWQDTILQDAAAVAELYEGIRGQEIVSHQRRGNLACTTYADGTAVYVNYGEADGVWETVTVPARGWIAE